MVTEEAITVVVPTRNSARTLEACLASIRSQTASCAIVVVDNSSTDATVDVARRLADEVVTAGPERSRQRNVGATRAVKGIVGFIDSDMVLEAGVAGEARALIVAGAAAVIVPERTVGTGYWSAVRAFERSMYAGSDSVEAARFFDANAFATIGGWDESITGGEDWDITVRVRRLGRVERTRSAIVHDEGRVSLLRSWSRIGYYAAGYRRFARKHGRSGMALASDRPYLRRPWILLRRPLLGTGLVVLKAGEALVVLLCAVGGGRVARWFARR